MTGNGNGNKIMGMGGNVMPKVISAHLYIQLISDSGRRHLRSASDRRCVVPRTHNTFGDRNFYVAGPRVWNRLPGCLRSEDISYRQF